MPPVSSLNMSKSSFDSGVYNGGHLPDKSQNQIIDTEKSNTKLNSAYSTDFNFNISPIYPL